MQSALKLAAYIVIGTLFMLFVLGVVITTVVMLYLDIWRYIVDVVGSMLEEM